MWVSILSSIGVVISLLLVIVFICLKAYCAKSMTCVTGKVNSVKIVGQSIDAPIFKTIIPTIKYKVKGTTYTVDGPMTSTPYSVGEEIKVYYSGEIPERTIISYGLNSSIVKCSIWLGLFVAILILSFVL